MSAVRTWQHLARVQSDRAGTWEYLPLAELERAEVHVAVAPLESALVHTIGALRDQRNRRRPDPGQHGEQRRHQRSS
jgi:hypothetical protein